MTIAVQENVAVMPVTNEEIAQILKVEIRGGVSPIFNLDQIANKAVRGAALNKVCLCRQEGFGSVRTVFAGEVFEQRQLTVLFDLVQRDSIQDWFNKATVVRQTQYPVRMDP